MTPAVNNDKEVTKQSSANNDGSKSHRVTPNVNKNLDYSQNRLNDQS